MDRSNYKPVTISAKVQCIWITGELVAVSGAKVKVQ